MSKEARLWRRCRCDADNIMPIKPKDIASLHLYSRLFLAVVRKDITDKLIYVYTFGCPGGEHDSFYIHAAADVARFNNPAQADQYVKTIQGFMQEQSEWPLYSMARDHLRSELEKFNQKVK